MLDNYAVLKSQMTTRVFANNVKNIWLFYLKAFVGHVFYYNQGSKALILTQICVKISGSAVYNLRFKPDAAQKSI